MKQTGHHQSRFTVLVAEDDPLDQRFLEEAWTEQESDAALHFVEDGAAVLAYLRPEGNISSKLPSPARGTLPSLILLDLNMPRMSGHEVLIALKNDPEFKTIPVVIISTSSSEHDITKAYAEGASSYITKPMTYDELVKTIAQLKQYWFHTVVLPDGPKTPAH